MRRPEYIILRWLLALLPLVTTMAPVVAQDTVYAGQSSTLSVTAIPGDTYVWELYEDVSAVNFATDPGNCPPTDANFMGTNTGPTVNVMWLTQGTYFYKVTASRGGCTMNLKVGKMVVLWELPTAVLDTPAVICAGDSVHLTVTLTGTPPWSFTLTDGVNNWVYSNITSSPYTFTVPVIPLVTTTYWISEVTDFHATNFTPSPPVIQVVNPKPVNSPIYQYGP
ncbi:MAG TPA: hypothetical protein PKJ28_09680 [Bacteroidales bacterium]|nr:hypothetical protein [Bacteroidales bacterium]HPS74674.1 hypothetical protein [Bacteroidales bacterium]